MATDEVQPLCQYCAAIIPIAQFTGHTSIKHYQTVGDLVCASRVTRCALCAAIQQHWPLQEIRERFPGDSEEQILQAELDLGLYRQGRNVSAGVSWVTLAGWLCSKRHNFQHTIWLVVATSREPWPTTLPIWRVKEGGTTSIPEKHVAITTWLSRCESDHRHCQRAPVDTTMLPKRLVRIGHTPGDANSLHQETSLRLVLSNEEVARGRDVSRYAALSHCWGEHLPVRTTKANVSRMSESILPIDAACAAELPRSFREAIEICRHIGIDYVWIDSLCIVQDDQEEWRVEAARMKDVYSNAWLTIAASSAENSTEGCFVSDRPDEDRVKDRGIYRVSRFNVATRTAYPAGDSTKLPVSEQRFAVRVYRNDIGRRTSNTALSERGWALQEQVLSRRIVHCTWPELHWQCGSGYYTEAGISLPMETSNTHDKHIRLITESSEFSSAEVSNALGNIEQNQPRLPYWNVPGAAMHGSWCQWMEHYSTRDFSFPQDQLAALAGMVQQTAENTGYTHILACWAETICKDLAWCGDRNCFTPLERAANLLSGIPSWSWISRTKDLEIDLWIQNNERRGIPVVDCCRLHRHEVSWEGAPLVSTLKHAELVLQGPMKNIRFSTVPEGRAYDPPYLNVGDDIRFASYEDPTPWECSGGYDVPQVSALGTDYEEVDEGQYLDGIYTCLLLRRTEPKPDQALRQETFLILELLDQEERVAHLERDQIVPTYRRLGIGNMRTKVVSTALFSGAVVEQIIKLV